MALRVLEAFMRRGFRDNCDELFEVICGGEEIFATVKHEGRDFELLGAIRHPFERDQETKGVSFDVSGIQF